MIDYIKGQIIELTPTELILECGGIGYSILISLQTYEALQLKTNILCSCCIVYYNDRISSM